MRRLVRAGHTRREILKRGAAGAFLLAGVGRLAAPALAGAATPPTTPIIKPLPPEYFINYGTNAEMIWSAVPGLGYVIPNERFFVRDHIATPLIDASTWTLSLWGDGLRGAPTQDQPISVSYGSCEPAVRRGDDIHRMRGQRAELLHQPAGRAGGGYSVGPRRDRCRDVARGAARRGARARPGCPGRSRCDAPRAGRRLCDRRG